MTDAPVRAVDILEALEVPRGQVLYAQTSADWIERAGPTAAETLNALLDWAASGGTLVMPSYPFHTGHREYLESQPTFDVRKTPSRIGLLPEMFRRKKDVVRSLDPDFSVAALGPEAAMIAGTSPATLDPFGADSSYQRMLGVPATLVGLGVSLNTTSFIHAIDSRAEAGYPAPVYEEREFATTVIDGEGRPRAVARKALRPPFQKLTLPSNINADMQPDPGVFRTVEINGARFFKWDLPAWSAWCLAHAARQANSGQWPCWLTAMAGQPASVQA